MSHIAHSQHSKPQKAKQKQKAKQRNFDSNLHKGPKKERGFDEATLKAAFVSTTWLAAVTAGAGTTVTAAATAASAAAATSAAMTTLQAVVR